MSALEPCGTNAAYARHCRNDEKPDDACKAARNAYNKAHFRAKSRLARRYPDAFAQLLSEELAKEGITP